MKRTLTILFLLIATASFAQTWQELNDSLNYYYQQSQFAKAVPVARKIVDLSKKEGGGQDASYATALNNLAYMLNETGDRTGAAEIYLESFLLRLKILEPDDGNCLSSAQSLASVYESLGKPAEAMAVYTGYLQTLAQQKMQQSPAAVMALYRRAVLFMNNGKPAEARKDLLAITATENPVAVDTILCYNTYDFLVSLMKDESDLKQCEPVFTRYIELCKLVDGQGSLPHIYSMYHLAGLYSRAGKPDKATPLMKEVAAGYERTKGRNSEEFIAAAIHLAALHVKNGREEEADKTVQGLLKDAETKWGSHTKEYESLLYRAASGLLQAKITGTGEKYLKASLELSRTLRDSSRIMARLYSLDSAYTGIGKTRERETLLREISDIQERTRLISDSVWASGISSLASIYIDMGDYAAAAALAEKYDSITQHCFTGDTEPYLQSRRDAAYLFNITERIDKAERYYAESMRVARKIWGEGSDKYARLLRNVGTMYNDAGLKQKAADLLKQAADILEKNQSTEFDQLADIYQKLASARDRSDTGKVLETYYLRKAVAYAMKIQGGENIRAILATNLAYQYETMGLHEQADSVYADTRSYTRQPGTRLFNTYLNALAQQAVNLVKWKKPEAAGACIQLALAEARKEYKDSADWEDRFLLFLTEYYRLNGQYGMAIERGKQMLKKVKKQMGEQSPSLVSTLVILTRLYFDAGNYKEAEKLISELNSISIASMKKSFEVLSDKEKEKYIANKISVQHLSNTLLLREPGVSHAFRRETFEQALLLKSLILAENRKVTASVLGSADTALQRIYRDWLSLRQVLSREYAKPKAGRRTDLASLEEEADHLQKAITSGSSRLKNRQEETTNGFEAIRKKLSPDEVVIEFVYFGVLREGADSAVYAAYIIRKDSPSPVFVPLFEKKQLQALFDSAGSTATSMVNTFYRGTELKNKSTAAALGPRLYALIWAPLEPHLKGIRKISYSPANKLFSIAFQALPADSGQLLMDRYLLEQYSSTRNLLTAPDNRNPDQAVLFGDPQFSMDSTGAVAGHTLPRDISTGWLPKDRGGQPGTWADLPGTAEEVARLKSMFEANNISVLSYTKNLATEERFKSLSGHAPRVLHLATHGFFLPEQKHGHDPDRQDQNTYILAEDPLLRSGLVLAGGNRAWSGKATPDGAEDGIVTAFEIAQLDLSNTELVVLSACETALGDIRGSEGVFGLQRAFKMAGVRKMIVSLWQVPDKETAELMTLFYSYWLKGKPVNESFALAQAAMRKKYPPYYWAAFVLVE